MYDTEITVVGTVLTAPERRKVEKTGQSVSTFRVVSNSRRFDRDRNTWVDGAQFRIRVNCWRRLADNVSLSLFPGEPVVIKGKITTHDWEDENGQRRTGFEMEAWAVGHDLSRGTTVFTKSRSEGYEGLVTEDDPEGRINGEPTRAIADSGENGGRDASIDDYGHDEYVPDNDDPAADAAAILQPAGISPTGEGDSGEGSGEGAGEGAGGGTGEEDKAELVGAGPGARSRRRGR